MIHLKPAVPKGTSLPRPFSLTLPIVQSLDRLDLVTPVTQFAWENTSGELTLLERDLVRGARHSRWQWLRGGR